MSKNKRNQKGGNQAKADKNLEALKKAKTQIQVETAKTEETKLEEGKSAEQPKVEKPQVIATPQGKSVAETYSLCCNAKHMTEVSSNIYYNNQKVKMVKAVFKNTTDNSTISLDLGISAISIADQPLRVKKFLEQFHELDAKLEAEAAKEAKVSKPAAEVQKPKVEKPKVTKVEKPKEEVIIPEVVVEEIKPTVKQPVKPTVMSVGTVNTGKISIASAMGKLAEGERISPSDTVAFMGILERNYLHRKDAVTQELLHAMNETMDLMAISTILKWNNQIQNDCAEVGIQVNTEMFEALSDKFNQYFNTKLLAAPTEDGKQMEIDFTKTVEQAPESAKEAFKQEVKIKEVETLPEYKPEMTEEESLESIRTILSMKNGMDNNLLNAIAFARQAFKLEKEEPAQVVATLLKKSNDKPFFFFNGIGNAVVGALKATNSPFAPHAWVKLKLFKNTPESEVANLTKVFLALGLKTNLKPGQKYEDVAKQYSTVLTSVNDDMINRMLTAVKSDKPAAIVVPKSENMKSNVVDVIKTINYVKMAYGIEISNSLAKAKLQEIMGFYQKPLNKLEEYVEKSAYADSKK